MPIYVYKCAKCGGTLKVLQKMDAPPPKCCGKPAGKVMAPSNFVLKGKGWFRDGYQDQDSQLCLHPQMGRRPAYQAQATANRSRE